MIYHGSSAFGPSTDYAVELAQRAPLGTVVARVYPELAR
jgi:hypothetical protein